MRLIPLLLCLCAVSTSAAQTTEGKKLIHYGWDSPDTAFLRKNLKKIESSPFDGIILTIRPEPGEGKLGGMDSLGWMAFNPTPFKPEQYEHAVKDLAASQSKKLTDNFIALISQPPPSGFDWFDDAVFKIVADNIRVLAKIAKDAHCAGIMFDPEEYAFPMWSYGRMPESFRSKHTYQDYVAKVRQRGGEFIKAINAEFPDITILCLFGPSLYAQNQTWAGPAKAAEANYNLLGPFYDGIVESAAAGTTLVDGYEQSYGFKKAEDFAAGLDQMQKARAASAVPDQFSKHVRRGFGLWIDNQSLALGGWFPPNAKKNHFTPAEWQASVHYALKHSDKYVWIYNERARWWDGTPGHDYVIAMRRARKSSEATTVPTTHPTTRAAAVGDRRYVRASHTVKTAQSDRTILRGQVEVLSVDEGGNETSGSLHVEKCLHIVDGQETELLAAGKAFLLKRNGTKVELLSSDGSPLPKEIWEHLRLVVGLRGGPDDLDFWNHDDWSVNEARLRKIIASTDFPMDSVQSEARVEGEKPYEINARLSIPKLVAKPGSTSRFRVTDGTFAIECRWRLGETLERFRRTRWVLHNVDTQNNNQISMKEYEIVGIESDTPEPWWAKSQDDVQREAIELAAGNSPLLGFYCGRDVEAHVKRAAPNLRLTLERDQHTELYRITGIR